jgi:glycosyltransferase involved in cell wall biosynthesis
MNKPLVSIIVPTYNSSATLEACLQSIAHQSYQRIELIVIDNNSKDNTKDIARKFTDQVINKGPERSAQRNYGVSIAKGDYVVIIDSDMELDQDVIYACVAKVTAEPEIGGLVIPEESFGKGFWAQCKRLERSFYVGVSWMEAARFYRKDLYKQLGGYNEQLVSGEDWDLSQRVGALAPIDRVHEYIMHNEGHLKLARTLKKKYYYAQKFAAYLEANKDTEQVDSQTGLFGRYKLYFSHPGKLFRNPVLGVGMLFMKTCEFGFGGFGYVVTKIKSR